MNSNELHFVTNRLSKNQYNVKNNASYASKCISQERTAWHASPVRTARHASPERTAKHANEEKTVRHASLERTAIHAGPGRESWKFKYTGYI